MKLTLLTKKEEVPGVFSFIFKPESTTHWKAGQFFHYVLHHEHTDDRGSDRWFTIASAPSEKNIILTTRVSKEKGSSFKKSLQSLAPDETIEVSDLDGSFVVDDYNADYVFIAGGIGITPIRSILKEFDIQGIKIKAKLLYANRDENIVYKDELEGFARNNSGLTIHYLISPERITAESLPSYVPDVNDKYFYVSGPEAMVESVGQMLKDQGVPESHLKQDWFPGYGNE